MPNIYKEPGVLVQETTPAAEIVPGCLGVIVGHERKAKGANSRLLGYEYDFNRLLADGLVKAAEARGLRAKIFLRDGMGVFGVGKAVDAWALAEADCDAAVELHFNASMTGSAAGTEVLYDTDPPASRALAGLVYSSVCNALGRKGAYRRNANQPTLITEGGRGFYNLRAVKIPSCLIEPVFGDNDEDAKLLADRRSIYVNAIVDAAIAFFKQQKGIPA